MYFLALVLVAAIARATGAIAARLHRHVEDDRGAKRLTAAEPPVTDMMSIIQQRHEQIVPSSRRPAATSRFATCIRLGPAPKQPGRSDGRRTQARLLGWARLVIEARRHDQRTDRVDASRRLTGPGAPRVTSSARDRAARLHAAGREELRDRQGRLRARRRNGARSHARLTPRCSARRRSASRRQIVKNGRPGCGLPSAPGALRNDVADRDAEVAAGGDDGLRRPPADRAAVSAAAPPPTAVANRLVADHERRRRPGRPG